MSYAKRKDGTGWRAVSGPAEITDDEVWQATQPSPISSQVSPLHQILALEQESMIPRVIREFTLAALELEGARRTPIITPEMLYNDNLGYRRLKDLDLEIATLRSLI